MRLTLAFAVGLATFAAACDPASLVDVDPPNSVVDPAVIKTAAGAAQLYNSAVGRLAMVYGGAPGSGGIIVGTGLFTDELMRAAGFNFGGVDERSNGGYESYYILIHQPRVQAQQARDALRLYAPNAPKAWEGRLYSVEGYAVLWFAENFCSGIPLTAVPLLGSAKVTPGFTTTELYERAIALFDSATVASSDTAAWVSLAKVGKGRALLGLGRFADAATAVQGVPTDFVYNAEFANISQGAGVNFVGQNPRQQQVVDGEGSNGLVWSTDPRTAITTTPALSGAMKLSAKYSRTSTGSLDATVAAPTTPIKLADGIEARLIEAEASLAAGNSSWLVTLNALRTTCIGNAVCAPVPGLTTASLPPLVDPGTASARIDLLFRERAMWLFLTGHRLGDLRRLARVYHRDVATLFPTGLYVNPGFPPLVGPAPLDGTAYGSDVVFNPRTADNGNPLYQGCLSLDP